MKVCARTMNAERRPRATDTATTGSFQNQPDAVVAAPPLKRKRGMSALLQDVTNLEDSNCRTARHKANVCATATTRPSSALRSTRGQTRESLNRARVTRHVIGHVMRSANVTGGQDGRQKSALWQKRRARGDALRHYFRT